MRAWLGLVMLLPLAAQTSLTPQEQRGRQLYERGTSASGAEVRASIGPGAPVAGAVLPCANCHGADGLGRAEGGIAPANVTWDALTKPYRVSPYTERLVKRAITMGLDADGRTLHKAMPRYTLTLTDAADLVAYLKVLGRSIDPGITASAVRIGVMLPPEKEGTIMHEALSRHFAQINSRGGIFGRTIEIVPINRGEFDGVFALCGSVAGSEREIPVPAIAILGEAPQTLTPYLFYLDSGRATPADRGRYVWDRSVAAAEILVEAMKRAGRSLTRQSLVAALESFAGVQTSLPQPITFGPARRIGILDQK